MNAINPLESNLDPIMIDKPFSDQLVAQRLQGNINQSACRITPKNFVSLKMNKNKIARSNVEYRTKRQFNIENNHKASKSDQNKASENQSSSLPSRQQVNRKYHQKTKLINQHNEVILKINHINFQIQIISKSQQQYQSKLKQIKQRYVLINYQIDYQKNELLQSQKVIQILSENQKLRKEFARMFQIAPTKCVQIKKRIQQCEGKIKSLQFQQAYLEEQLQDKNKNKLLLQIQLNKMQKEQRSLKRRIDLFRK